MAKHVDDKRLIRGEGLKQGDPMVLECLVMLIIHFHLNLNLLSNMLGNFRNISEELLVICNKEGVLMEKIICQVCFRSDE